MSNHKEENGGHIVSNLSPSVIDATIFAQVFEQNWENARHIKTERISFMNAYSLISAGVLTLLQSVHASDMIRIGLLLFMSLFSLFGLLTSHNTSKLGQKTIGLSQILWSAGNKTHET